MRMWKVDPTKMCRKHLLGEHVEMHMFVGTMNKGIVKDFSKTRYVTDGLVEVHSIRTRHEELAAEMVSRGYDHNSRLDPFEEFVCGSVDKAASEVELRRRCKECKF